MKREVTSFDIGDCGVCNAEMLFLYTSKPPSSPTLSNAAIEDDDLQNDRVHDIDNKRVPCHNVPLAKYISDKVISSSFNRNDNRKGIIDKILVKRSRREVTNVDSYIRNIPNPHDNIDDSNLGSTHKRNNVETLYFKNKRLSMAASNTTTATSCSSCKTLTNDKLKDSSEFVEKKYNNQMNLAHKYNEFLVCSDSRHQQDKDHSSIISRTDDKNEYTVTSTTITISDDDSKIENNYRTGIVVESSIQHADPNNLYHKERPERVKCIVNKLQHLDIHKTSSKTSPNSLWDRCIILFDEENNKCSNFYNIDKQEGSLNKKQERCSIGHNIGHDSSSVDVDCVLRRVHKAGYLDRLNKISGKVNQQRLKRKAQQTPEQTRYLLDMEASQYESIYLSEHSIQCAKHVVGLICRLVEQVVTNQLDNGFAVCRPPGHHADSNMAGGYCIYNNIAAAASYALAQYPETVQKIMIIDWDVHHGNGTQSIFYNQSNVLYFSIHRWDYGNYYPYLKSSGPTYVGEGDGTGYNVNVAWTTTLAQSGHDQQQRSNINTSAAARYGTNKRTMLMPGDEEYYAVWDCLLLPIALEYQPDLILISAGFDAADGDTIGGCHVTPQCYANLTKSLMSLFCTKEKGLQHCSRKSIPIVCTLEGGYVRKVLSQCVYSVIETLLNSSVVPSLSPPSPNQNNLRGQCASVTKRTVEEKTRRSSRTTVDGLNSINPVAASNIRSTIQAHRPYWKCLQETC